MRSRDHTSEDALMGSVWKSAHLRVQQVARLLPSRTELHVARKVWHMGMGLFIVSLYMGGISHRLAISLLSGFLAWSVVMETIRLRNPALNEKCIRFFGPLMRSSEIDRVSGMPFYIASALVAVAVFPTPVATLSLLYLALGDPIASFFGILYRDRSVQILKGKTLHGTAAGFAVCALTTWIYLRSTGMLGLDLIRMTLLGGFAGSFAELLPLEIDDNFTIPVVSGFIVWTGMILIPFV